MADELPDGFRIEEGGAPPPGFRIEGSGPQYEHPRGAAGAGMLSLVTGALSQIPAGLSGVLAAARNSQLRSRGEPEGASAADVVQSVSNSLTFQPRTQGGREAAETLSKPFALIERGADIAGDVLGGSSPAAETAVKTLLLGGPSVFGLPSAARIPGGIRPRPRNRPQQIAADAQAKGYVVDPAATNPAAGPLTGAGGKIKTQQLASQRNQAVTNRLIREEFDIPDGVEITPDVLASIRRKAAESYEAVRGAGRIDTDVAYRRDLARATEQFRRPAQDFPSIAGKQTKRLREVADSLETQSFDAASAVDAMRLLRQEADAAFRKGRSAEATAWRRMADALEGAVERDLSRKLGPDNEILTNFRQARQTIAKTHSVEKALDGVNVNAHKLARQLNDGKPLSGNLFDVAKFAQEFPKLTRIINESVPNFSPLDMALMTSSMGGAGLAGFGLGPAASTVAALPFFYSALRPAIRSAALGKPGQAIARSTGVDTGLALPGVFGSGTLADEANR